MKKIAALVTALILAFTAAVGIHMTAAGAVDRGGVMFDTWVDKYKDKSYDAVAANISDRTVLYMGSSEFRHGRSKPSHPTQIFRKSGKEVMCMGSAYDQSLFFAVASGSFAKSMENRKAVILLSPSWFTKGGVSKQAFASSFSERQYVEMISNRDLPEQTRRDISKRVRSLLSDQKDMLGQVETADSIYLDGNCSAAGRAVFGLRQKYLAERDLVSVGTMWSLYRNGRKDNGTDKTGRTGKAGRQAPDFGRMLEEGSKNVAAVSTNRFNMMDRFYSSKFKPVLVSKKDSNMDKSFEKSPEYGDLALFLDVCRASGLKTLVVLQPINCKWYDYTGFKPEKRNISAKVGEICSRYDNTEFYDMTDKGYEKGYFEDNVHPSEKGWAMINEKVYRFFE